MTLIKKIQLAAEQNGFNVYVTGSQRNYKLLNIPLIKRNAYKVITGDGLFKEMCNHLIQTRQNTEGYRYICHIAGVSSNCVFIDGDLKYEIIDGKRILVYKIEKK